MHSKQTKTDTGITAEDLMEALSGDISQDNPVHSRFLAVVLMTCHRETWDSVITAWDDLARSIRSWQLSRTVLLTLTSPRTILQRQTRSTSPSGGALRAIRSIPVKGSSIYVLVCNAFCGDSKRSMTASSGINLTIGSI